MWKIFRQIIIIRSLDLLFVSPLCTSMNIIRIYIVSEPELYLTRYRFTNFLYVPWNFRNKASQGRKIECDGREDSRVKRIVNDENARKLENIWYSGSKKYWHSPFLLKMAIF